MFKNLIKKIKSNTGNSLAEFAVVTAMMGTLATTAAPKFGGVGDAAKARSAIAAIDNAIEECLDQAVYLEKAKRELQEKWTLKH